MNEFDLRKFLYNNPLLESEAKLKAAKEKLEKQEAKIDKVDMKDENAKEKAKHHKVAAEKTKKEIDKLKKDLAFDKKAAKKEEKEAKEEAKAKKKKDMKEGMSPSNMRKYGDIDVEGGAEEKRTLDDEARYNPKMTREGLKDMIREKITSILNEEEELMEQEDVDVDVEDDVNVKDKEEVDVDVEKDVEVDDVSKETDIDVKTSLPGESEDVDAVLGLLTKAREEADRFADDPELGVQIGNTITYFTRKHVAQN